MDSLSVHGRVCSSVLVLVLLLFSPVVRADFSLPKTIAADSVSGQFMATGPAQFSPLSLMPEIATNTDFVRLEPALLAVSAERVKTELFEKLGADAKAPWKGKIFLTIHPARALDENVAIYLERFGNGWNYHVLLPDVLARDRFARALTGAVLLELANRDAGPRSAEVPDWLIEGLVQELLAENLQAIILSAPGQTVNGLPLTSVNVAERGMDSLVGARRVLQIYPALTFAQLSWPTDTQLTGEDGGAYRASAQLLVDESLHLPGGAAKLRAMLALLPRVYNWQTAFQAAFRKDFPTPLAVEKWWTLKTVAFAAQSPGPQWTLAASRWKLDEILSVPVEVRTASNAAPARTEISLQTVIRNFDSARQTEILETRLRDLELAQLRMAPSLAVLTAQYRNTLAAYLGESRPSRIVMMSKHARSKPSAREMVKTLDALDAWRRAFAQTASRGL